MVAAHEGVCWMCHKGAGATLGCTGLCFKCKTKEPNPGAVGQFNPEPPIDIDGSGPLPLEECEDWPERLEKLIRESTANTQTPMLRALIREAKETRGLRVKLAQAMGLIEESERALRAQAQEYREVGIELERLRTEAAAMPEIIDLLTRGKDALRARVTRLTEELAISEEENRQLKALIRESPARTGFARDLKDWLIERMG